VGGRRPAAAGCAGLWQQGPLRLPLLVHLPAVKLLKSANRSFSLQFTLKIFDLENEKKKDLIFSIEAFFIVMLVSKDLSFY